MLGDCLERMAEIPDGSVDMVLCDPPYGTTACKWDSVIPFEPMWEQLKRVIKPSGAIVMTASQPFTSALVMSNIKMFKYCWVWEKNAGSNFGAVRFQPMKEHEDIAVFAKGKTTYNPIMQERSESGKSMIKNGIISKSSNGEDVYGGLNKGYDNSKQDPNMRYPRSIQRFNRERGFHKTQKPVALMEYLIKTYTNEGETVLDFTMGSGTTGVACANTGRCFIGIEKDADFFRVASERISSANINRHNIPWNTTIPTEEPCSKTTRRAMKNDQTTKATPRSNARTAMPRAR
jgi:site-specific DNA-methyltransferase (adenine-specific)